MKKYSQTAGKRTAAVSHTEKERRRASLTNDEFRHSFKQAFHSSLGLAVYSCGIQKCSAGHAWGPAVRDHYLIHCVTPREKASFPSEERIICFLYVYLFC